MTTHTIDCGKVNTEADFWILYLQCTNPEGASHFGRNLAAFWDALAGGPGYPGECSLRFINTETLRTLGDGGFYKALHSIASDCTTVSLSVE